MVVNAAVAAAVVVEDQDKVYLDAIDPWRLEPCSAETCDPSLYREKGI